MSLSAERLLSIVWSSTVHSEYRHSTCTWLTRAVKDAHAQSFETQFYKYLRIGKEMTRRIYLKQQ